MQDNQDLVCGGCGDVREVMPDVFPWHHECGYSNGTSGTGYWRDGRDMPRTVVGRGLKYVKSYRRWLLAGKPTRAASDVDRIREICKACDHNESGKCIKCGCKVSSPSWLGDKPAWATENCPIGKW